MNSVPSRPTATKGDWICTNCLYVGRPVKKTRGSLLIEIVLWICFILPGLIYTLWRMTSKLTVCPLCKSTSVIPADSPRGRQLADIRPRSVISRAAIFLATLFLALLISFLLWRSV